MRLKTQFSTKNMVVMLDTLIQHLTWP